ncbi:hypothetical protein D3C72_1806130 [compost metagenome]
MASRSDGMPGIGGYWLWPAAMAAVTSSSSFGSQWKSGKPWPRFTAFFSAASVDITVKMVVPTAGSLVVISGVRGEDEGVAVLMVGRRGEKGWRIRVRSLVGGR